MKNIINWLNEKKIPIFIGALFMVAWLLLTYLLPKETKFKYEFQKGKPWLHEDLIATYDFPIYKLDDEIEKERDSITSNFKPYLNIDAAKGDQMIASLQKNLKESIQKKQEQTTALADTLFPNDNEVNRKLTAKLLQDMQFVYAKGVLPVLELDETPEKFSLVVMRGNFAEELDNRSVFSQLTAYRYMNEEFLQFFANECHNDSNYIRFFEQMNMDKFITPNLVFDHETTEKVKQSQIESVSYTHGMVQKGQRIISRGEMVGDEKFSMLYSLKKEFESESSTQNLYWVIAGQLLLVALCLYILFQFLNTYRNYMLGKVNNILFMLMLLVGNTATTAVLVHFNLLSIYLIPYVVVPILLKNFFDARVALINHIINIVLSGFIVPNSFEFLFIQFTAGFIGMYYLTNFYRRGSLTTMAGVVFVVYVLAYTAFSIIQEGEIRTIDFYAYLWFAGNSMLLLISYPSIYIFEKVFGFVSELTLIELGDVNHPLLRELAEKAPGTFQHSLQVANLGESAAFKIIDANPLLVRTGALYHDIGKTDAPQFFVENQISGINPHDQLPFDRSAEIIIGHVMKGVEIARKHKLPNMVTDFIRTHHGTSKAQYFYRMYQNQFPDKEVDPEKFTYPGPKPYSKETAIMMMADAVEAASRSLKEISEKSITTLIDKIVGFQMNEGQFSEADITFKDISTVKKVFKQKLMNIYHARIEYPEEKKKEVEAEKS